MRSAMNTKFKINCSSTFLWNSAENISGPNTISLILFSVQSKGCSAIHTNSL